MTVRAVARPADMVYVLAKSAGAVTAPANDTNENVLATISVPAGAMGTSGALRVTARFTHTNSANTKTVRIRLGGAAGTAFAAPASTTSGIQTVVLEIANRGSASLQYGASFSGRGTDTVMGINAPVTGTVDTSVAQDLVITGQKATGSEALTLERYVVEVMP